MVWDSNDGLARALVLRAFGYLAGGVVNVPGAIYRIQQSLISTSESEYEAALQAALEMSVSSPSFVVPVLAESILYLYKNVSSFSFLRPKILQILSLRTNSWRVERMIFYSLLNIREDFFLREYLETMMQIVLRSQSLQQPYLDLLGRVPNSEAFRKRMMEVLESIC